MIKYLTNAQMRAADRYTMETLKHSSLSLMERAGGAIAEHTAAAASKNAKILVVCGGGNNGGDGYVCARLLLSRGYDVKVWDVSEGKYSPDCTAVKKLYAGGYDDGVDSCDIIVDCIFGTGLCRKVEGKAANVIRAVNASGAYVISADIPSGINGDNGLVEGVAVKADITVAIAQYKFGHILGDGVDYCGKVVPADIGIEPVEDCAVSFEDCDVAKLFPPKNRNSNKGTFGSACLVAGSKKYPGAAALCIAGALRSGCGYVKSCVPEQLKYPLAANFPQAVYLESPDFESTAMAVGCGLGCGIETYELVSNILKNYRGKLILDADGLNALARYGVDVLKDAACRVIVTPHIKEFSRISGLSAEEVLSDPVGHACQFSQKYHVDVLLKSTMSVITDGKNVIINTKGCPALAKGGSGDMLAGLLCGTAARGLDLLKSAVCSTYLLGRAAEIASLCYTEYCVTALDIANKLPQALKEILLSK